MYNKTLTKSWQKARVISFKILNLKSSNAETLHNINVEVCWKYNTAA